MDFVDQIKAFATQIPKLSENINTEEATKNALIMPLINILGYNVFDPAEVVPEFTADHGTKKGEKVDYAIMRDGKPAILIECKNIDSDLNKEEASQLFRYFSVTEVKIGVLTNGIIYRFYSDLDAPNKMDDKAFLEINLLDIKDATIGELKRFTKESFDPEDLTSAASELKYTKEIKNILAKELDAPSNDFVKFFAKQVYSGILNQNAREKFTIITKNALNQFINERINERLKSAMAEEHPPQIKDTNPSNGASVDNIDEEKDDGIVTTPEEWEGYYIIKGILREVIDAKRVAMRDTKSYCGILLDDNNRKPICRLLFNTKQKYIVLFDRNKEQQKVSIEDVGEIYTYANQLKDVVKYYDE